MKKNIHKNPQFLRGMGCWKYLKKRARSVYFFKGLKKRVCFLFEFSVYFSFWKKRWREIFAKFSLKLTGTSNFCTSATAWANLILARFSVSSTVIRTCNSSDKCSQLGLPLLASSWKSNWKENTINKNKNKWTAVSYSGFKFCMCEL